MTLLILVGLAGGLWAATKKIDYTWRWNRVPQYFVYQQETVTTVPFDGVVEKVSLTKDKATVTVRSEDDEIKSFTVDANTVKVSEYDDLFEGDSIGSTFAWKAGPLVLGLWTTLWLSAAASMSLLSTAMCVVLLPRGIQVKISETSRNILYKGEYNTPCN